MRTRIGPTRPVSSRELPRRYFTWAAVPTVIATSVTAVAALLLHGGVEAVAVLLGGAVVLAFFGIDLLAMRVSAGWDPAATFLLVMVEYFVKIVALAFLFLGLRAQDRIPDDWVGIGLAVAATVFLAALVTAYLRIPTFVVEPEGPTSA